MVYEEILTAAPARPVLRVDHGSWWRMRDDAALFDRIASLGRYSRGCPFLAVTLNLRRGRKPIGRIATEARDQRSSLTEAETLSQLRQAHRLLLPKGTIT